MGDTPLNPISSLPTTNYLRTQFQIESGGMVQINLDFFSSCDLKLKLCQLSIQKIGLIFHFQEVTSFSKRNEKNQTHYKKTFFFQKTNNKKYIKFCYNIFFIFI